MSLVSDFVMDSESGRMNAEELEELEEDEEVEVEEDYYDCKKMILNITYVFFYFNIVIKQLFRFKKSF